jgi:hypothetical protein
VNPILSLVCPLRDEPNADRDVLQSGDALDTLVEEAA